MSEKEKNEFRQKQDKDSEAYVQKARIYSIQSKLMMWMERSFETLNESIFFDVDMRGENITEFLSMLRKRDVNEKFIKIIEEGIQKSLVKNKSS